MRRRVRATSLPRFVDPEALHILAVVAQCQTFAEAAQRLGATRTGVAKRIARFERELGLDLVTSSTRRVALTATALQLVERGRPMLEAWRGLLAPAAPVPVAGPVRIAAPARVVDGWLAPRLALAVRAAPAVVPSVTTTAHAVDPRAEGYDLALGLGPAPDGASPVGALAWRLVASPAYLAARGQPASADGLAGHVFVRDPREASLTLRPAVGPPVVVTPRAAIEVAGLAATLALAADGLGIARLPAPLADARVATGELAVVLPDLTTEPDPIWLRVAAARPAPRVSAVLTALRAAPEA